MKGRSSGDEPDGDDRRGSQSVNQRQGDRGEGDPDPLEEQADDEAPPETETAS